MARAIFIGFLSLQYALAMIGKEGTAPTDPTFHELAILAHAAADLGGWTSIAIFALSTLIISLVVRRLPRWSAARYTGLVSAALAPLLFLLSISYLFTLPSTRDPPALASRPLARIWRPRSQSAAPAHRPPLAPETVALIRQMAAANRLWGAERICGELLKLDIRAAKRTIQADDPDGHARSAPALRRPNLGHLPA